MYAQVSPIAAFACPKLKTKTLIEKTIAFSISVTAALDQSKYPKKH
jgi:hypothetical protein